MDIQNQGHRTNLASLSTTLPETTHLLNDWSTGPSYKPTVTPSRQKIKTRPVNQADPTERLGQAVNNLTLDDEKHTKIPLKSRAFSLITLMYPTNALEASKSIEWDQFVHAIGDMGFTARSAGCSAVSFEKVGKSPHRFGDSGDSEFRSDGEGEKNTRIDFHKPHPISKIDPVMIRGMGRRMSKWFGWGREGFELEI